MAEQKSPDKPVLLTTRLDLASILGIVLALGGIIGGLVLEGGKISDVTQVTAAIVVLGGTFGAVLLTSPLSALKSAAASMRGVFFDESIDSAAAIDEIVRYATKARKSSVISLEEDLENIEDPFLQKALSLAVDGTDLKELRAMMELELNQSERRAEAGAKVFEAAGGYSPTVGIIGAVMGLIQVMKHLENIDEVGRGIAVSFVATVYGVAAANLFFLPAAGKIKARLHEDTSAKELLLEGVIGIVEGMNPKLIRVKLEAFVQNDGLTKKEEAGSAAKKSRSAVAVG